MPRSIRGLRRIQLRVKDLCRKKSIDRLTGETVLEKNHQPSPPDTTLVYAVDQRNAYAMMISLSSALEQSNGLAGVCVLYSGNDQERVSRHLQRTCGEISFRLINAIDELQRLKGRALPLGTIGDVAYLKFLVPEFVETPRAVFLDADTIVLSDLRGLYEQALHGRPVGAVQDWLVPTVLCQNSPIRDYLDQVDDQPYLNSGVMVMDIERLRRLDLLSEAAKYRGIKVRLFRSGPVQFTPDGKLDSGRPRLELSD